MASAKEIRNRIDSVRETRKITNAMYLIASTKLRRAREDLERTRPFFTLIRSEIRRIFRAVQYENSRYFYQDAEEDSPETVYGILVITADKGLAGAYNMNAIREAHELLDTHDNCKLYVVGEYGRQYFTRHGIPVEKSFLYTAQNPTMGRARDIALYLLNLFQKNELDKIFVVYTDLAGNRTPNARSSRLLPFHRNQFMEDQAEDSLPEGEEYEFFPSMESVLEHAMLSYVSGFIYSCLVDSFCCEQHSRMVAMQSANDNADALLENLSLEYNRVRQAAVTQEITEVSAGARAQKLKRLKKAKARAKEAAKAHEQR